MEDTGKYACKCNETTTACFLAVDERKQLYHFNQKLPRTAEVQRGKDLTVECSVSDPRAKVEWFHKGEKIEVSLPEFGELIICHLRTISIRIYHNTGVVNLYID
ncbi:unnamed protein product [Protopolystoma xenopodis]|uniref:Ig-like domain-containing protein n=1 Tax=Protopolystoma xenopodis TaxID=117903 RepID=A0A3S5FFF7_9PLAT|nr:unnamed protein product [Protopolystoma xenopodis]